MKPDTLPDSWTTRPLGQCGEWVSGGTPSKSRPEYWNGEIPWFSAKSLKSFDLVDAEDRVTELGAKDGTTVVPPGTILFVVRGMSLANEFRVGITTRRATLNQDLRGIIAVEDVDPRYLARFMRQSPDVIGQVDNASHGTKRIETDRLKAVRVPLPPLAEQKRIADILDKADAIRRKRREARAIVQDMPLGAFRETFKDHLGTRGAAVLSDVAEVVSGVAKGRPLNGAQTREVPYLRVANVQAGYLDLSAIKTIPAKESEVKELALRHGDVVMTEGGDHDKLGRGALWEHYIADCIHQNHVFRVRTDRDKLLPTVFAHYLQTDVTKAYFLRCAKKTSNLASINMTQLRALPVPLPPIKLQQRFERELRSVSDVARRQTASSDMAECLFASLVQRAFRGEL